MNQDWRQSQTEESMVLGLLDLFTSLILQNNATEKRQITELLCIYSRSLAETIQTTSLEHMKTRPFIQWILAKTLVGMGATPQCSDAKILEEFPGLLIDLGDHGVHLPIFVPVRHSEKPGWDLFQNQANATQIRAIEIAVQAATDIGDYALQSLGLKILALHSKDPGSVLEALANVQLSKQGDREGFLQTCLAKYLTLRNQEDEEKLLESFEKVEHSSKGIQNKSFIHPTLLWARDVIRSHLEAQTSGELEKSAVWWLDLDVYNTKLPRYVVDFVSQNLSSMRSSSNRSIPATHMGRGATPSGQASGKSLFPGSRNHHHEDTQENRKGPMPTSKDSNPNHSSPFNFLESESALASSLYSVNAAVHAVNPSMNPHGCAETQMDTEVHSGDRARPYLQRVDSAPEDDPHARRLQRSSIKNTSAVEHRSDRIANDSDSFQREEHVRKNEGLPELDFSPSLLDNNTLTVTIRSKTDPTTSTIYTVDTNGVARCAMKDRIEPGTTVDDIRPDSQKVDDSGSSQRDDSDGLSTYIRVNGGWPKLELSPSLLDNNTLTVTLTSKTDSSKSTVYVVDESRVAQSAVHGHIVPPSQTHDAQPNPPKVELGGHERMAQDPGVAEETDFTPKKMSSPAKVKDRRADQDRLPPASRRQHQRDEDLASQLKIQQRQAETTQLRDHHEALGHNDRAGYIPRSPVAFRPINRTLSDRFQLNQSIGRTSSWPLSVTTAAEYDSHPHHKKTAGDSSKTGASKNPGISKEVLDQLNEESAGKKRRSGSVTANNDPDSAEHSVVEGQDLSVEKLETSSDEEDQEEDPTLLEPVPDRMKSVPQPPPRRKVHIREGQHEHTTATAGRTATTEAESDRWNQTPVQKVKEKFEPPSSAQVKGEEKIASEVKGSSEPGAKRKPLRVSIQTEEDEEKHESNDQVEAKSEPGEQEGQHRKEEEGKLQHDPIPSRNGKSETATNLLTGGCGSTAIPLGGSNPQGPSSERSRLGSGRKNLKPRLKLGDDYPTYTFISAPSKGGKATVKKWDGHTVTDLGREGLDEDSDESHSDERDAKQPTANAGDSLDSYLKRVGKLGTPRYAASTRSRSSGGSRLSRQSHATLGGATLVDEEDIKVPITFRDLEKKSPSERKTKESSNKEEGVLGKKPATDPTKSHPIKLIPGRILKTTSLPVVREGEPETDSSTHTQPRQSSPKLSRGSDAVLPKTNTEVETKPLDDDDDHDDDDYDDHYNNIRQKTAGWENYALKLLDDDRRNSSAISKKAVEETMDGSDDEPACTRSQGEESVVFPAPDPPRLRDGSINIHDDEADRKEDEQQHRAAEVDEPVEVDTPTRGHGDVGPSLLPELKDTSSKSELAEQERQQHPKVEEAEETRLAKENAELDQEAAELELLRFKKEKFPKLFTSKEQTRLNILAIKFEEKEDSVVDYATTLCG